MQLMDTKGAKCVVGFQGSCHEAGKHGISQGEPSISAVADVLSDRAQREATIHCLKATSSQVGQMCVRGSGWEERPRYLL